MERFQPSIGRLVRFGEQATEIGILIAQEPGGWVAASCMGGSRWLPQSVVLKEPTRTDRRTWVQHARWRDATEDHAAAQINWPSPEEIAESEVAIAKLIAKPSNDQPEFATANGFIMEGDEPSQNKISDFLYTPDDEPVQIGDVEDVKLTPCAMYMPGHTKAERDKIVSDMRAKGFDVKVNLVSEFTRGYITGAVVALVIAALTAVAAVVLH